MPPTGTFSTVTPLYLLGRGRRSGLVAGAVAWVEGGREVRFGERFSGPTLTDRPPGEWSYVSLALFALFILGSSLAGASCFW